MYDAIELVDRLSTTYEVISMCGIEDDTYGMIEDTSGVRFWLYHHASETALLIFNFEVFADFREFIECFKES